MYCKLSFRYIPKYDTAHVAKDVLRVLPKRHFKNRNRELLLCEVMQTLQSTTGTNAMQSQPTYLLYERHYDSNDNNKDTDDNGNDINDNCNDEYPHCLLTLKDHILDFLLVS